MERGGCIETITPLLEAAARVINDRIGRELFIFIIDRARPPVLWTPFETRSAKYFRFFFFPL